MKFLINIETDSELVAYEAIALAFVLASFDHTVQLLFKDKSIAVLQDNNSRLYGMVQSLDLYDMGTAWATFTPDEFARLDDDIQAMLCPAPDHQTADFDSVLTF